MAMNGHVLIVAATDSSGGAGLSCDVGTVAAFGLPSAVAVTAVTVQTHQAVRQIEAIAPAIVAAQMRAAMESQQIAAIKIGMLATAETVASVAAVLTEHEAIPVVLDPVLAASSGGELLTPQAMALLRSQLMPLCRIVTPNIGELARLSGGKPARNEQEIMDQGMALLDNGARSILVKGGHGQGCESVDFLLEAGQPVRRFSAPRLCRQMRGTGCMLASAIAAAMAAGSDLENSVAKAKNHVFDRLLTAQHDKDCRC